MRPSERARREREPLRVPEVARVLERDPHAGADAEPRAGASRARSSPTSRTFAANASARSSPRSQPSSLRCDPQPDVLTTTRSTSSNASIRRARERLPLVESSGVHGQRAAAALGRRDDLEAVGREDACGRGVDVGEHRALDAAREEADARARRAARRRQRGHLAVPAPARRDLDERSEPLRHRLPRGRAVRVAAPRACGRGRGGGGRAGRGRGDPTSAGRAPPRPRRASLSMSRS